MTRAEFMRVLSRELQAIDKSEREEILSEYEEHFAHASREGRDEAQVAQSLGDPKALAKEIRAEHSIEQASNKPSLSNVLRALLMVGSLGFFNLVVMLLPFLFVVIVVVVLYGMAAAFALSPLIFLVMDGIPGSLAEWLNIGTALALCAASLLLWRRLVAMTQRIYRIILKYLRYNASLIKGRVGHNE